MEAEAVVEAPALRGIEAGEAEGLHERRQVQRQGQRRRSRSAWLGGTMPSWKPSMVISPCGLFMVARRWTNVQSGFGTVPPKLPECTSRLAWRARNSNDTTPRDPNLIDGRPEACICPIGGDDEIGAQFRLMGADEFGDMRAADLLLALQQQDDVARQPSIHGQMRPRWRGSARSAGLCCPPRLRA